MYDLGDCFVNPRHTDLVPPELDMVFPQLITSALVK